MGHTGMRNCTRCGARIARDNSESLCSPCRRTQVHEREAPRFNADFWNTDDMRSALASKNIGIVVRAYRYHPVHGREPLSQTIVAQWVGTSQAQLSRVESGRSRIRDLDKLTHYARCLHIPANLLWFDIDDADSENHPQESASVFPLPSSPTILAAATHTELALAESLLIILQGYATTDNLAGPHSLLPIAKQQMGFAERILARSRGHGHRKMLYVCARFAEFNGWLHQDTGDLRSAMQWSNTALDLAQEADDTHLVCYIHMRKSNIASDAGKPGLAMAFARAALQNPGSLTPRLKAVALRQEAHGNALAGNRDACSRALDQAFRHATDAPDVDLASYCTPSYVEMEAAHCWIELGQPDKAITTLQQGLAEWSPNFRRDLGLCLARLAVAHAGAAQPDEALTLAEHSLSIAVDTRSHRTMRQLHRGSKLLATVGADDQAQQLRHRLRILQQ